MSELIGGRYRIVEQIGGGGTALVYRAETARGLQVAVKQLRPQFAADPALRRRFLREAELARRLDHPGVLQLLDAGDDPAAPFMVMELATGQTLRQRLDREGNLPFEEARVLFAEIARALDHAHARGIIHRDVKPENVFVTQAGAKLGDFGNARIVSLASVTGASLSWGTPEYVAPEVFIRGRADPRSDLYSLGIVLYEMLTGYVPWSRSETLTRLGGASETPTFGSTGAGTAVDRLLADLLAFSPAGRPASGEEAIVRLVTGEAGAAQSSCSGCGAPRPDDLPRCLACGQPVLVLRHDLGQNWRLVLRSLSDDAAQIETLMRLVDTLAEPFERAPLFLTGDTALYSKEELVAGVELPAVLFSDLSKSTAQTLERLFAYHGLDVAAIPGSASKWFGNNAEQKLFRHKVAFSFMVGLGGGYFGGLPLAIGVGATALVAFGIQDRLSRRTKLRERLGTFRLRRQIAAMPEADHLLVAASAAVHEVRAPDVSQLLADVSIELYRLSQRAETRAAECPGPSSDVELLRRTTATASRLLERLRVLAARLGDLDRALEGQTEGELMQTMARLERAATAAGGDGAALGPTRGDLEAALERRHAAEQERARLSAALCQLLGWLRLTYRQAVSFETPVGDDARALEAAVAEVDALLAAPPDRAASG